MGNFFLLLNSDPIIGGLADLITNPDSFPYEEIPGFPQSTVEGKSEVDKILKWTKIFEGHVGRLLVGLLNGIPVLIMQGRFHSYEGYPLWKTAMPVRVMKLIGIEQLIATNAGGGLNQMFNVRQMTNMMHSITIIPRSVTSWWSRTTSTSRGSRVSTLSEVWQLWQKKAWHHHMWHGLTS